MSEPARPSQLGHSTIARELGRGGMGVVYLATDTNLDRRVAIKALPADSGRGPQPAGALPA